MIYSNRKRLNESTRNFSYIVEENDSMRVSYVLDTKNHIIVFTWALIFQVVFGIALVYMILERIGIFHIIVAILINLFTFACVRGTFVSVNDRATYSLTISSQGIRNTTYKDEVFLPWSEFGKIGMVENVKVRQSRVNYCSFIYISNLYLGEDCLRKIIVSPDSEIYVTTESELVIAIRLYSEEETKILYSKLTEYIDKFNSNNSE